MSLARWYHEVKELPEMRVHVAGTPDVPDLIRPGDWLTNNGVGIVMAIKLIKCEEGEWDYCPGAESWQVCYLGIGYMTERNVSIQDCGCYSQIVAVNGRLLQLYKLGWNEKEVIVVPKPEHVTVSKSAMALLKRESPTVQHSPFTQLELFAL